MPKLTGSQLVILSAAAQRDDGRVLPLPRSLKFNKGAATGVLKSLVKRKLIAEQPAKRDDETWRDDTDGRPMMLVITDTGREAIDGGPNQKPRKQPAARQPQPKKGKRRAHPTPPGAKRKTDKSPPAVRQGTKQALMIDLLNRKKGATIDEIVEATGWQPHSVRGAISGALKKKLGLAVDSDAVNGRGRVYRIAGNA